MSLYEFSCSVYMGDYGVDVYSNGNAYALLSQGDFIPFIPEYRCETSRANSGFIVELDFGAPFSLTMSDDRRLWYIRGSGEELRAGNTVPYLLHYILEIQRMQHCQVTLHGAGVAKDGQAALILGKQGSGKTSLCLELCRRHGYSLIGNDLVLLGLEGKQAYLYGGTKIFRLRHSTIAHHNSDLQWAFKETASKDDWTVVAVVTPEMINVTVATDPVPLHQIVYVHLLNDPTRSLHVAPVERMFSRLYLHEEASRYIRGVCFPMFVGANLEYGTYVPSLDSSHFHTQRKKLIAWIQGHPQYRYISGPMDKMCAYLTSDDTVQTEITLQP